MDKTVDRLQLVIGEFTKKLEGNDPSLHRMHSTQWSKRKLKPFHERELPLHSDQSCEMMQKSAKRTLLRYHVNEVESTFRSDHDQEVQKGRFQG
jgi:hypothetical protein